MSQHEKLAKQMAELAAKSGRLVIKGVHYNAKLSEVKIQNRIGHGVSGRVSQCSFKNIVMAIKEMRYREDEHGTRSIVMDLTVVTKARHPNIVVSYGYFLSGYEEKLCLESMTASLSMLLAEQGRFSEEIVKSVAADTLNALNYLETDMNIIHRDVKPANMLIDFGGTVKICDFGMSAYLDEMENLSKASTIAYQAPEIIQQLPNYRPDTRSDVWSLGVSLIEMINGRHPFTVVRIEFQIVYEVEAPSVSENITVSAELREFLSRMTTRQLEGSSRRANYTQLLAHPFILQDPTTHDTVGDWLCDIRSA